VLELKKMAIRKATLFLKGRVSNPKNTIEEEYRSLMLLRRSMNTIPSYGFCRNNY